MAPNGVRRRVLGVSYTRSVTSKSRPTPKKKMDILGPISHGFTGISAAPLATVTMTGQSQSQKSRFNWTDALEQEYLDCLVEAMKQGKRTDTGWKPQVNADVVLVQPRRSLDGKASYPGA